MKRIFPMRSLLTALVAIAIMVTQSCKRDDDVTCPAGQVQVGDHCEDEQEVITTVTLHMRLGNDTTAFSFRDADGVSGNPPVIDTIRLLADSVYLVDLEISDESKSPPEDLTVEIAGEKNDHQFFFIVDAGLNLAVVYKDQDDNGYPVGLSTQFTCGSAGTGNLELILKHQPGIKDGNQATGSTDIDAVFPVVIQ